MAWVAIDEHEGEFEIFNRQMDAINWCNERIESIRGFDGWREGCDMQGIQVAEVQFETRMFNKILKEDYLKENPKEEWFNDEWEYVCDYKLVEIVDE